MKLGLGRTISWIVLVVIVVGIGKGWYYNRYRMSPLEFAYATCLPCELTHAEVDDLIDDARHSTLTRAKNRDLFIATFVDRADAEECLPCVDAILDVSELP